MAWALGRDSLDTSIQNFDTEQTPPEKSECLKRQALIPAQPPLRQSRKLFIAKVVMTVKAHELSRSGACGIFLHRDQTHVSCTGRQIPYRWATREAQVALSCSRLLKISSCLLKSDMNTWKRSWKWKSLLCLTLQPHGLYSPWNSPGQNSGVGCHALLQGIFPTQGSKPGLPHCRQIVYQLSHKGNLEKGHSGKELELGWDECKPWFSP